MISRCKEPLPHSPDPYAVFGLATEAGQNHTPLTFALPPFTEDRMRPNSFLSSTVDDVFFSWGILLSAREVECIDPEVCEAAESAIIVD